MPLLLYSKEPPEEVLELEVPELDCPLEDMVEGICLVGIIRGVYQVDA